MATHRSCDRLVSLPCFLDNDSNSKFGEPSIIIDTVESPTPDEFPGIYCQALPERPWLHDNQLLLSSYVRSNITALTVDLSKKSVTPFTLALPPTEATVSGFEVLDVHKSFVLLEQTKFNEPPIVFLIRIDQQVQQVSWTTRLNSHTTSKQATELAKTMNVARRQFTATDGSEDTYEGFHLSNIGSVGSTDRTLMVVPHGGPHSCFSPYWGVSLMTFFLSGFDLLLVNYRGSTGFGKRYIDDLAGRCGSMDVNDVYEAIRATREAKYQNVVLHGGSHGGFLVGHLVGQFPDLAVAACLRNPVTNIASMTSSTDIRDWAFVESNGIESFASSMGPQTAEQNEAMFKKSPIAHAHKIKTPCLILIGSNDLRVPSYQGREFHFVLKGRGIPTRLLEYSDNHTLSDVPHDFDGAINAIQWFVKNINRTV